MADDVRLVAQSVEIDVDVQPRTVQAGAEQRDRDADVARGRAVSVRGDDVRRGERRWPTGGRRRAVRRWRRAARAGWRPCEPPARRRRLGELVGGDDLIVGGAIGVDRIGELVAEIDQRGIPAASAARSLSAPVRVLANPLTMMSSEVPSADARAAAEPPPGVGSGELNAASRSRTDVSSQEHARHFDACERASGSLAELRRMDDQEPRDDRPVRSLSSLTARGDGRTTSRLS